MQVSEEAGCVIRHAERSKFKEDSLQERLSKVEIQVGRLGGWAYLSQAGTHFGVFLKRRSNTNLDKSE